MSNNILKIVSSLNPQASTSHMLAREATMMLQQHYPESTVTERDTAIGLPAIDASWINAAYTPQDQRSSAQQKTLKQSEQLIAELSQADEVIIAVPMYNFSLPTGLKSWIDHVVRAGVTFTYQENGPVGLLKQKPVTLIISSGGVEIDSANDFVTPYLRHVLGFIGLTNVRVIAADAMNVDPQRALDKARQQLQDWARHRTLAA